MSEDFDLLIELIAHALADNKETSMLLAHDQAVARQRQKLTSVSCPCGSWTTGNSSSGAGSSRTGGGLDGTAMAEERDNYHGDAYENAQNHASGLPTA